MKMSVSLTDELSKKIDLYSKEMFMTKSGFISMCVTQYLLQKEAIEVLSEISPLLQKINTDGFDEETKQKLADCSSISDMIKRSIK